MTPKKIKKMPQWAVFAYYQAIAEEMQDLMTQQNITQAELANRLGVSAPYVNKLMKGETNFTIESLAKIAHALNTELTVSLRKN